jgi:hypothetical protein
VDPNNSVAIAEGCEIPGESGLIIWLVDSKDSMPRDLILAFVPWTL